MPSVGSATAGASELAATAEARPDLLDARIYEPILAERFRFFVVPDHLVPSVQRIAERHETFVVVEKRFRTASQPQASPNSV